MSSVGLPFRPVSEGSVPVVVPYLPKSMSKRYEYPYLRYRLTALTEITQLHLGYTVANSVTQDPSPSSSHLLINNG